MYPVNLVRESDLFKKKKKKLTLEIQIIYTNKELC